MLHVRRDHVSRSLATLLSGIDFARHWLMASDPGLMRLMLAVRGTTSVLLATLAALLAARLSGQPLVDFAGGITLSMLAPFLMREPTLRQRQRTLQVLLVPAAAATVGTTLLHGQGMLGDSAFLLLVFVCFLLHPRNPRVIAIGLVAVVTCYVGLYLELPPATLPLQLLSLLAALPIVAFAGFVVVPMDPAGLFRRTVAALQWRAARVLHTAQQGSLVRLRRDLAALNEAALAADDQLALLQPHLRPAMRAGLIDLELATARLIAHLRAEAPTGPATARQALRLRLHQLRMRRGDRYAMTLDLLEPGSLRAGLVQLGHIVHGLRQAADSITPQPDLPLPPPLPPGPLGWRLATRVTLAAVLAMAGGIALSPQRWFWAVLTVYVVFLNARSRGDTIHKGVQRLGGTLLGMGSGLVLATLLARDEWLQAGALLISVFGMFYFIMASYTAGIICVTVMLGLLYGMLGAPLEVLLTLRLEETAIGALAAILVAAFVFPTRTRDQVMRSGRNVLAALAEAVGASREALSAPSPAPLEAMRRVDRQVADLRLALAPLTAGRTLLRRSALERPVPALLDCVHWTREVVAASQAPPAADAGLIAQAAEIERSLAALSGSGRDAIAIPADTPSDAGDSAPQMHAALDRLQSAVATLAERLEIGALEGFAL